MSTTNLLKRAATEPITDYNEFIEIFVKCTKLLISRNIENIHNFPEKKFLFHFVNRFYVDKELLDKNIDFFNNWKQNESLIEAIITTAGGGNITKRAMSKHKLEKKRKLQLALLESVLEVIKDITKVDDIIKDRTLKLHTYTLNSYFLYPPPGKVSNDLFCKWLQKANEEEKALLLTVYRKVGKSYCNQGRINKKNFNALGRLIYKLKHC